MPFVHVENGGLDAERAQQPHAAEAEQHLLHDAGGGVAAVDPQREVAVELFVFRAVAVEQVDRASPHVRAPGLEVDPVQVDVDIGNDGLAVGAQHGLERQRLRVEPRIVLGLPAVLVDRLLKIPLAVEDADPDETDSKVAGRAGVIAGEYPEPACRDRQRFVEADFGREISHGIFQQRRRVVPCPGVCVGQVRIEGRDDAEDALRKSGVLQSHAQFVVRDLLEDRDGVVVQVLPAARRQLVKDLLRLLIPGPPQVGREAFQTHDQARHFGGGQRSLCHKPYCAAPPVPDTARKARRGPEPQPHASSRSGNPSVVTVARHQQIIRDGTKVRILGEATHSSERFTRSTPGDRAPRGPRRP